ncbi:MAG TPA: hypothetical protein PLA94_25770 [Myxococcota bacterium]|nr:hypothetical protein [Myxococcota bacterium]
MKNSLRRTKNIPHPTDQGDVGEGAWQNLMATYLPRRYAVTRGTVIDVNGEASENIDLIIHDPQYTPFLLKHHGVIYVPSESVYAVFEVKPALNKTYVEAARQKAASVRRLHRTSVDIVHAGGVFSAKPPTHILAGLLCGRCEWAQPFRAPFDKAIATANVQERLDFVACLERGVYEYQAELTVPGVGGKLNQVFPGLVEKDTDEDNVLLSFFFRLCARLQGLGTVVALDHRKWLETARSRP